MKAITDIKGTENLHIFKGYILRVRDCKTKHGKDYVCASFRRDTEEKEDLYVGLMCYYDERESGISIADIIKKSEKRYVCCIAESWEYNGKRYYKCIHITTFPYDDDRVKDDDEFVDIV